jgi:hypothetical protein
VSRLPELVGETKKDLESVGLTNAMVGHVGASAYKIFEQLGNEKEKLSKALASLDVVWREGKTNIHVVDLAEEDCVEEYTLRIFRDFLRVLGRD